MTFHFDVTSSCRANIASVTMTVYTKLSSDIHTIRGDLIQVYKIINGMDNLDWHDFFEKAAVNITRRSNNKLFVKFSRTNKRKNAFSN